MSQLEERGNLYGRLPATPFRGLTTSWTRLCAIWHSNEWLLGCRRPLHWYIGVAASPLIPPPPSWQNELRCDQPTDQGRQHLQPDRLHLLSCTSAGGVAHLVFIRPFCWSPKQWHGSFYGQKLLTGYDPTNDLLSIVYLKPKSSSRVFFATLGVGGCCLITCNFSSSQHSRHDANPK